jgi:hypothetical protein
MQSKASKEKASTIASYSKNWRKIQILLQIIGQTDDSNCLKGLKELNASEDARYFSSLGNQKGPFLADQSEGVSWIWKVAMLSVPLSGSSSLTAVSREEQWASEGNYQDSNEWLFTSFSAWCLQWLHCFNKSERLKEEVLLLKEELRRIGSWHHFKEQYWEGMAKQMENCDGNWEGLGFFLLIQQQLRLSRQVYHQLPQICMQ